jgi:hypothetical protein
VIRLELEVRLRRSVDRGRLVDAGRSNLAPIVDGRLIRTSESGREWIAAATDFPR